MLVKMLRLDFLNDKPSRLMDDGGLASKTEEELFVENDRFLLPKVPNVRAPRSTPRRGGCCTLAWAPATWGGPSVGSR